MSLILENEFATLIVEPEAACYRLIGKKDGRELSPLRIGIEARQHGRPFSALQDSWGLYTYHQASPDSITLMIGPDAHGLQYQLRYALLPDCPACTIQLDISNQNHFPVYPERITLAASQRHTIRESAETRPDPALRSSNLFFLSNGWQSWSPSRVYRPGQRQFRTAYPPAISPMIDYPGTQAGLRRFPLVSDGFGVLADMTHATAIVLGFLSQRYQFGTLGANLNSGMDHFELWANAESVRLDPDATLHTDTVYLELASLEQGDVLRHYYRHAAVANQVTLDKPSSAGWCSWYQYYQAIDQPILLDNLKAARQMKTRLPFTLFQIDDGYENKVGDWNDLKDGFPQSLAGLAGEISAAGMQPGLWIAPFIVQSDVAIGRSHPDYLLKGVRAAYANAGYGWNGLARALDLTHPGAYDYVMAFVQKAVQEWGFSYLKLDFLYAAALPGQRLDPTRTGANVLHEGMKGIRSVVGDETFLLGCGMPLLSGLGLVDGMRVSPDIGPSWEPRFFGLRRPFKNEISMPAAKNALYNTITRAGMHRRWWINDPDCLLLRDDTNLSLHELQTLVSVAALTGGMMLNSDDLTTLAPERLNMLAWLLPLLDQRCEVIDLWQSEPPSRLRLDLAGAAGQWQLLAYINWSDRRQTVRLSASEFGLDDADQHVRDIWTNTNLYSLRGMPLWHGKVERHGVVLLAVRGMQGSATYLGSNLHISSGLEVAQMSLESDSASLDFEIGRKASGSFDFYSQQELDGATMSGIPLTIRKLEKNIYRIGISLDLNAKVTLQYR